MKRLNRISILASIVMLGLIISNILMLSHMKTAIENGSAIQDWMGVAVAVLIIVVGFFHILGLLSLVAQFQHLKNDNFLRAVAFVIGVLSLFFLAVDVMMLSDIGHEYQAGFDISGEWQIVFAGHAVHTLFSVLLLVQCAVTNGIISKHQKTTAAVKDEVLFLTVNQIGIISAILGFSCLLLLSWSGVPQAYLNGLQFLFCIVFLIPYGLAATCWLVIKRKEKPADWYDEKQFADVSRGAFFTLVTTVFITMVFYFLTSMKMIDISTALWFPEYLFLTLLLFSGRILYLTTRD